MTTTAIERRELAQRTASEVERDQQVAKSPIDKSRLTWPPAIAGTRKTP
jgi:hypothetical protein